VVGLGYIGLPTAAMFATHGLSVHGVDVSPRVIDALKRGTIHIEEPGLEAFVRSALQTGRLTAGTTPVEADAFILAVPTPCREDHKPDLSYIEAAAESILPVLRPGNLVILESTSPPGTTLGLVPILERSGLKVGEDLLLAHSPERVLPGRILTELVENDRVIGGHTPRAAEEGAELYRAFVRGRMLLTDATTAEFVKLIENTYRDVNIALANELARVSERIGIDVHEAISIANHHPRVNILRPGPGVGGHCIAVDPWFVVHAAPDITPLIQTSRTVNDEQPAHVAEMITRAVSHIPNPTVAVLGLAYKADVDDLRESPSVEVAHHLKERGVNLRLHDAYASALPDGTALIASIGEALDGADALVILTDHAPYRALTPASAEVAKMRNQILIDTRASVDGPLWRRHGFAVWEVGVGAEAQPVLTEALA
jgi:UDP-N-acetyl-D-mannosaminuronic acid dehydrogenase